MDNIIKKLPAHYQESIKEIIGLFDKVDFEVSRFVEITGIHCPSGCGQCCNSYKIETTVLEMLPVASSIWGSGDADKVLSMLSISGRQGCVFFNNRPDKKQTGCCSIYEFRPLICRLFGFFTIKDKNNKYVYGSCKIIKENYPDIYNKALGLIDKGMHPSSMTDFAIRIIAQGSDLGRKMLPVNTALRIALEKIGLVLTYIQNPPETPEPKAA